MADTTTLKVSNTTRNRLQQLAADDYDGASVEKTILALIDEHYRNGLIADWDRLREEDPDSFQQILDENEMWDRNSVNPTDTEGPYRSDDPDWIAAGGLPLTEQKDAA